MYIPTPDEALPGTAAANFSHLGQAATTTMEQNGGAGGSAGYEDDNMSTQLVPSVEDDPFGAVPLNKAMMKRSSKKNQMFSKSASGPGQVKNFLQKNVPLGLLSQNSGMKQAEGQLRASQEREKYCQLPDKSPLLLQGGDFASASHSNPNFNPNFVPAQVQTHSTSDTYMY